MNKRKTPSLCGSLIREALLLEQPWLKSEELPEHLKFHVGPHLIDDLHNNSKQLIVGRRGTGKTHLLKAFKEHIDEIGHGEVALFVSILELSQTPPTLNDESADFKAQRTAREIFHAFLRAFFKKFLEAATKILEARKLTEERAAYSDLHNRTNNLLTRLLESIELGRAYRVSIREEETEVHQGESKTGKGAGVKLSTNLSDLGVKVQGHWGTDVESKRKTERQTKIDKIISLDLSEIRALISEITQCLNIKTLYILIDEWMELEKNTPSEVQPYFAQWLKIVFFNDPVFAVKIASVWHQTTLYDKKDMRKSHGIQLGQDIHLGADLDTAFLSQEEDVMKFCKELLFRRLKHTCPELARFEKDGVVDDIVVTELFDNATNFKAFIASTHGIPRDIMEAFHKCSLQFRRDFTEYCIDLEVISQVAKNKFLIAKRKNIEDSSTDQRLLQLLTEYVAKHGTRLFLVENKQVKESRELRKLVDEEIVHQIPSAVTHALIRDSHKAFHVDYGKYVEIAMMRSADLSALLTESVLAKFPDKFTDDVDRYVVDVLTVSVGVLKCTSCKKTFLSTHPVFVKASVCPHCGERQPA